MISCRPGRTIIWVIPRDDAIHKVTLVAREMKLLANRPAQQLACPYFKTTIELTHVYTHPHAHIYRLQRAHMRHAGRQFINNLSHFLERTSARFLFRARQSCRVSLIDTARQILSSPAIFVARYIPTLLTDNFFPLYCRYCVMITGELPETVLSRSQRTAPRRKADCSNARAQKSTPKARAVFPVPLCAPKRTRIRI